jgi:PAS domain S-box-containing protein
MPDRSEFAPAPPPRDGGGIGPARPEDLLRTVVRNVPVVLFALDREGFFTFSDGRGLDAIGLRPGEAVGKSVFDLFAEYPDLLAQIRRALAGEAVAWSAEVRGMFYEARCSPIYGQDGRLDGLIGVSYDVTDRRRAEQELRRALAREERIARTLQRPLALPLAPDLLPGLGLAARYEAALDEAAVGGDLYDAFSLPGGRVALAVADASGKGLPAAARAIQVREVQRAFARETPDDPARVLARLNDYLCDARDLGDGDGGDDDGEAFVAAALVLLDPRTGEGAAAVAGAEPPLLLCRGEAGGGRPLGGGDGAGLPLGVERGAAFATAPFTLRPGDALLLFTDGVAEAHPRGSDPDAAPLGEAGVARLAAAALARGGGPGDVADAVLEGARAFAHGAFRDDACLLVAQRL